MSALAVHGLRKAFRSGWLGRGAPIVALEGVSLTVEPGESVGWIGESGSGKTTLARVALGLIPPDQGEIRLLDQDMTRAGASRWRAARRHAQLLFQDPRAMLHPAMRLSQILAEGARLHRPGEDPSRCGDEALERVGLAGRGSAFPRELSGGERRRAGLARVLLARPALLIADEPTAGLDAALRADLVRTIRDAIGPECALVLISHDLPLVRWATSRVVVLSGGRVVETTECRTLGTGAHHPVTRALLDAKVAS